MKWYTIIDYILGVGFFILTMMQTSPFGIITAFMSSVYLIKAVKGISFDDFINEIKQEFK